MQLLTGYTMHVYILAFTPNRRIKCYSAAMPHQVAVRGNVRPFPHSERKRGHRQMKSQALRTVNEFGCLFLFIDTNVMLNYMYLWKCQNIIYSFLLKFLRKKHLDLCLFKSWTIIIYIFKMSTDMRKRISLCEKGLGALSVFPG